MIENKTDILFLREKGLTYSQIGDELGIPMNTVKSYCRRAKKKKLLCKNCGKVLVQIPKHKKRIFCSNHCCNIWWANNGNSTNSKANYNLTCIFCGKEFNIYANSRRKYCSHECYVEDRFGKKEGVP